jgi:hypothetical protein
MGVKIPKRIIMIWNLECYFYMQGKRLEIILTDIYFLTRILVGERWLTLNHHCEGMTMEALIEHHY